MRVVSLEVESFKRLIAVEIVPQGAIVEITGENSNGKSSVLDAIWAALGGKDAVPGKPIHTGAERAQVQMILAGDGEPTLKVTRRFKFKGDGELATDLIVESAEGARFSSPQAILDALVGSLCFDPLGFMRLKDEEQIKALRGFVPDVDFDKLEGLNRADYDARTEVNRRVRDLKGQLAAMAQIVGDLPDRVDLASLEAQMASAAQQNAEVQGRAARRQAAEENLAALERQIAELTAERDRLKEQLAAAEVLPAIVDIEGLRQKLAAGREANAINDRASARQQLEERIAAGAEEEVTLSARIEQRKYQAAAAVKAAQMPVPGLGFGEGIVTLNGEPLAQASQAEKIRVGVAIAAAMNPRLRVAMIKDGSLLDAKSWAILADYAEKHDLQIWCETVSQKGAAAVVISNGQSVAAGEVPKAAEYVL